MYYQITGQITYTDTYGSEYSHQNYIQGQEDFEIEADTYDELVNKLASTLSERSIVEEFSVDEALLIDDEGDDHKQDIQWVAELEREAQNFKPKGA